MKEQLLKQYKTAKKNNNFVQAGKIKAELKSKYHMNNKEIENSDDVGFLKDIFGMS